MKRIFIFLLIATFTLASGAQPTTIQVPVAAGTDDADESVEDNLWVNPGDMSLDNDELEMIYDDNVLRLCHVKVGIRFANVTVPQGATIIKAYIQFTCKQTTSDVVSLTIHGQNSNNATPFTDISGNISARPLTTSSINWMPLGWYNADEAGIDQRTPSLVNIVQEIVNRPQWASGSAMAFIVSGSGDSRTAYSYDSDASKAALLVIQYSGVGIEENNFPIKALITPNPVADYLTLLTRDLDNTGLEFFIFDVSGKQIKSLIPKNLTEGEYRFDISDLSPGMYFLNIKNAQGGKTLKFIKK